MEVDGYLVDGSDWRMGRENASKAVGSAGENIVGELFLYSGIPVEFTGYHHPLDLIIAGKYGVEVKSSTFERDLYIGRAKRRRKREYCQRHNLIGVTVAVVLIRKNRVDLRYRYGFKSFPTRTMLDFGELYHAIKREVQTKK